MHGLVLEVDLQHAQAVIRHDAVGGMPSMTMAFRVAPNDLRTLHAGEWIDAEVDEATEPWSLHDVHTGTSIDVTGAASSTTLRDVLPIQVGDRVPATAFVDQRGKPFSFAGVRGQTVVLAFVYTRCRDARMCPLISAKFRTLQQSLTGAFHLVEVSLDPSYDRPPVLARYGTVFGADPARWTLATGKPGDVLRFDAQFGITPFPDPRIGLIHTERTVIIDPSGIVRQMIDEASWSPGEVIAAARSTSHLSANAFERFSLWLSSEAVALCGNSVAGFSGVTDLAIVLLLFGGGGFLLYTIARRLAAGT
jgi:protein SCO1/2